MFKDIPGSQDLFDVNYIEFIGPGVSINNSQPEVILVEAITSNLVKIVFAETLLKSTAENVANYSINNKTSILGAYLQPDNRTLLLNVSDITYEVEYILEIAGAFQYQ